MIRKTLIAATAVAALAATSMAPTTASAGHKFKHRHHGWVGPAIIGGALLTGAIIAAESRRCERRVWVDTEYGPRKVWVNVC